MELEQSDEAAELLDAASNDETLSEQDRRSLMVELAMVLIDAGDHERARGVAESVIRVDESAMEAWYPLAMGYGEDGYHEAAAFCLEQAAGAFPQAPILTILARFQLSFDVRKALATAQRAVASDPGWDEGRLALAEARRAVEEEDAC